VTLENNSVAYVLRDAVPADIATIASLVMELATYEKLAHEARATAEDFRVALFGRTPRAHAMIAEIDGSSVGFALYFFNFSTFVGRPGLYVEDVFIQPTHRGRGIGRAFFQALAARAIAEGCGRMEWAVLDWNEPAIKFYHALGAVAMNDWTVQRLAGDALRALAGKMK
jgi:GNAT superfamily N-acetyltransferase